MVLVACSGSSDLNTSEDDTRVDASDSDVDIHDTGGADSGEDVDTTSDADATDDADAVDDADTVHDADSVDADVADDANGTDAFDPDAADATPDASTCDPSTCVAVAPCTEAFCESGECVVQPQRNGSLCDSGSGVCDDGECSTCADTATSGIDAGCTIAAPNCAEGACIACVEEGPGCVEDCAGTIGGLAREDACGICDEDPANDCIPPCEGDECPTVSCTVDLDCDDRNPCTADACVEGVCSNDGAALESTSCDDFNVCTNSSTCTGGLCVGSDPISCEGPCLTGACHRASGCVEAVAGSTCTYCPEGDDACGGELPLVEGACDVAGECLPSCAPGSLDPAADSPCVSSRVDVAHLVTTGYVRCIESINEGARCASDGYSCTTDLCNADGECEHVTNEDVCSTCDTVSCDGPCYTGDCADGRCTRVPTGTPCDDGSEDTVDDVCDAEGVCVGSCPELECGRYFSFGGDACGGVVTGTYANAECETDNDPCTVDFCNGDGTCGQSLRPAGSECDHLCGTGECSAAGVCELVEDDCTDTACYDAACNEETGACEIADDAEPTCHMWSNTCDGYYGACVPEFGDWCGDRFCEVGGPTSTRCPDCPDACLGSPEHCTQAYHDVNWAGAWRANQSTAYGYTGEAAHQSATFQRMLSDGFRWLHWTVDFCTPGESSGPLCLCEGNDRCLANTFYLEDGLDEVAEWMDDNPSEVVTLYVTNHATGEALRTEVGASRAWSRVFARDRLGGAYETFPFSIGQMANMGQTLVIIGNGFISPRNVFAATHFFESDEEPSFQGIFQGGPAQYPCTDATGATPPTDGLYAIVHSARPNSFNGAACYNTYVTNHQLACQEFREEINVTFMNHYNSTSWLNAWATGHQRDYVERCNTDVETCATDDDCEVGVCGGLFICLNCTSHDDCEPDQHCDGAFGSCMPDLPDGAVCIDDAVCQSGTCELLCQSCTTSDDCDGDEWCDVFGGCQQPQPIGAGCVEGRECLSGTCWLGYCVECDEQGDCSDAGEFCSLDPLPGESACIPTRANGEACAQDFECTSGDCFLGFCASCNEQSDCPGDDEFCSLNPLPGESACIDRKPIGYSCVQNFECASGDCFLGFCAACNDQSDCPNESEFCSLDPAPGASSCIPTKANGSICASSFECQSDQCTLGFCGECVNNDQCPANQHCDAFNNCAPDVGNNEPCLQDGACTTGICSAGFCAECTSDGHCASNAHCDAFGDCVADVGNNAPCTRHEVCNTGICSAGFCAQCTSDGHCAANQHCDAGGDCVADVGIGSACIRDSVCSSGACHLGFCAECNDQSDCPASNDFCSLDPVPGASSCIAEKANGSLCANAFECESDRCTSGFCGECTTDGHCPANEHCDAFNNCVADVGNNAPCIKDSACSTGICSAGFCAQCTSDGHCAANQHCDVGGDCIVDVGNNAPCTRNEVCNTGICSAGFCAQCTSDGHCAANQHCDVFGDCVADVGNNAPCTRNAVCNTGICSAGFCAQCTSDGHCSSSQFCNGGGDCQGKLANGSLCVEHRVCSSGCCGTGFCGGLGC